MSCQAPHACVCAAPRRCWYFGVYSLVNECTKRGLTPLRCFTSAACMHPCLHACMQGTWQALAVRQAADMRQRAGQQGRGGNTCTLVHTNGAQQACAHRTACTRLRSLQLQRTACLDQAAHNAVVRAQASVVRKCAATQRSSAASSHVHLRLQTRRQRHATFKPPLTRWTHGAPTALPTAALALKALKSLSRCCGASRACSQSRPSSWQWLASCVRQ